MAFPIFTTVARVIGLAGKAVGKAIGIVSLKRFWRLSRMVFFVELFVYFRRLIFQITWLSVKIAIFLYLFEQIIQAVELLFTTFAAPLPTELSNGIARVLPNNFTACITAILSTKFFFFVLSVKDRVLSSV
ncbi:DUF5455 family protein [Halomonas glaciei]|jgi:hypothetical protein|uniref:DUF5455 family protein n=2 Tax=Vreelandella TaxID=3137766 RepID=A0A7Z0RZR8_9GAMM|nr:DUF5455 family protein [Halomonas glaciei]NYS79622.1 DUF5455 family protein [Halomonas glaciei]|tara:strand:- start:9 stop:401 length:393 start_codon:yes stop_codon:yes gene_type:complete